MFAGVDPEVGCVFQKCHSNHRAKKKSKGPGSCWPWGGSGRPSTPFTYFPNAANSSIWGLECTSRFLAKMLLLEVYTARSFLAMKHNSLHLKSHPTMDQGDVGHFKRQTMCQFSEATCEAVQYSLPWLDCRGKKDQRAMCCFFILCFLLKRRGNY